MKPIFLGALIGLAIYLAWRQGYLGAWDEQITIEVI